MTAPPPVPDAPSTASSDLALLTVLQGAFAATLPSADLTTPVPWCGRWRVKDLAVHLARIHHWAAGQAARTREAPLGRGPFDVVELYGRCAAELRDVLATLDPAARAWTLLDDGVPRAEQTGTVAFWHRRQKLETLVHLWDLRTALGLPLGLDDEEQRALWADCIDEVVTVMHPRQVRLGRVPAPSVTVRLETTDGRRWRTGPGGGVVGTDGIGAGAVGTDAVGAEVAIRGTGRSEPGTEVIVSGTAQDLALLLWGRLPLSAPGLLVESDTPGRATLEQMLARGLTP